MISSHNRGIVAGACTRQARAVHSQARPERALLVVQHITLAAAVALRNFVAFPHRRPNPTVKRTNIGGAHHLASLAFSAPLFAAYLLR